MLNFKGKAALEIAIVAFIQTIMVILKLIHIIPWEWVWVWAPAWLYFLFILYSFIYVLWRFRR